MGDHRDKREFSCLVSCMIGALVPRTLNTAFPCRLQGFTYELQDQDMN